VGLRLDGVADPQVVRNLSDRASAVLDATNVVGDPGLVNPDRGLFWLGQRSVARGKGRWLADAPTDLRGVERPRGAPTDLGAYQFSALDALSPMGDRWQYRFAPGGAEDLPDPWP
jgi:hypothetical protein